MKTKTTFLILIAGLLLASPATFAQAGGPTCAQEADNLATAAVSETVEEIATILDTDTGSPIVIDDLTSVPPATAVMGRCIVREMDAEPEVGYSYAIAKDGTVSSSGAGGWARAPWENLSPSVPMTSAKRMTIASVSKPITAMAVMRLLEENPAIDLDDPFYPLISSAFAGWWINEENQLFFIPGNNVGQVTIRDLLTHRSGLKPGLGCGKLKESLGIGVVGTPGVTYDYENANFCLLREVIEQVSGEDYVSFVSSRLLWPLGIFDMTCDPDLIDPTLYYNTNGDAGFSGWGSYAQTCSAYGWYASADNLATLIGGLRSGAILSQTSIDTMLYDCPGGASTGYCNGWNTLDWASVGVHSTHSGDWIVNTCGGDCPKGSNATVMRFELGIDASLLINTRGGKNGYPGLRSEASILRQCFNEAFVANNP